MNTDEMLDDEDQMGEEEDDMEDQIITTKKMGPNF